MWLSPRRQLCSHCPFWNIFGLCKAVGWAFLPPPPPLPPPFSPPRTLPLTHPGSCSRAAFLEFRVGHAICFADAILAFKRASLFVKLLTIRCGRFKSPLDALGPLPFLHLGAIQPFCSLVSNCCITKRSKGWNVLYTQQLRLSFYHKYVYIACKSVWMRKF